MLDVTFLECNSLEYIGDSKDIKVGTYILEDIVLIRTTDVFPFDGVVETPIHGVAYGYSNSILLGNAISKILRKQYSDVERFIEEKRKYELIFENLRRTIHFTINGLVSSHMYGNFDGRDYIIIDPLKYHINDNSLCSLDACDTYFNDNMVLSDEAVLIIRMDKYNEIKDKEEYVETLKKFKTFVYSGNNEKEAVREVLEYLGYDSFVVNDHGYVNGLDDGTAANEMWKFLNVLREMYGKVAIRHFGSSFHYDEVDEINACARNIEIAYLDYLLVNFNFSSYVVEKIESYRQRGILEQIEEQEIYDNYYNINNVMIELVEEIGLDNLCRLTKEFNERYLEDLRERKNGFKNKKY